ncbi:type II secretion system protein [bacterium]|nr:type II secretion system protein [bacterium]
MTDNLEIHKVKERIKMNNMKQTQDDRTIQPFNCSTIQRACSVHLNARKFLSNLVPQCLRTFCNGLLRFTRNDGLFTVHRSQFTQAAFTLAETLIVIGIIGVVAALTLPNLNHATGDKEKVTKVKKIYSSLTDAFDRAQAVYGPFDEWFNYCPEEGCWDKFPAKRITEFMKVSKECGYDDGCFSDQPFTYEDGTQDDTGYLTTELKHYDAYMFILSDGTSLAFYDKSGYAYLRIIVDIDGPNKGKNQYGSDLFDFYVCYDEDDGARGGKTNYLYPSAFPDLWTDNLSDAYLTAWVIENGNLDYLKATKTSYYTYECPNGKILDWTTNTSCH